MSADRRRLLLRYGGALLLIVLLIAVIGPRGRAGAPLDPRSTAPTGTRGVLEVLERLGGEVRIGADVPAPGEGAVALVIADRLADGQRDDLRDWVLAGGRLVLADPFSDLAPDLVGLTSVAFTEPSIEPACDDPLVAGVGRVAVAGGSVFAVDGPATGCFPRNGGSWMVRTPTGEGEVIALGGPLTLTNELLGREDTAVLLVNLLLPEDGSALAVVTPEDPDAGEGEGLADVLPPQVGTALLQLPLAWLALVWWRARRHGRPVEEATPVRIEAAETTIATGNLLHRAGRAGDAAAIIRARLRDEVHRRLGIPELADDETFVAVAASRTDIPADSLRRLLVAPLPTTDDGLVRYADAAAVVLAGVRQRRTADPTAGSTAPTDPPDRPADRPADPEHRSTEQ